MKNSEQRIPARSIPPIHIINWMLGIGIIEIPIGTQRPILSVFWSIVNFLTFLAFLRMANLSQILTFHGSAIAANNFRIIIYICTAFIAISICLSHITKKLVTQGRYKVHVLNQRLSTLGIPDDYKMIFKARIIEVITSFAFIFVLMVLDFAYAVFDVPSDASYVGIFIVSHYLLVFSFVVDGNFTMGIKYLGNRFQHLNKLLAESNSAKRSKPTVERESDDEFQRYSSVICEIHQNNSLAIKTAEKQWLLYVIRETRILHRSFCNIGKKLERAFGIQALFSVALSFGLITTLFYTSYVMTSASYYLSSVFLDKWKPKACILMWITFYALKILLIVNACETTSYEANRTGVLITDLLDTAACDEDIRDEIDIFSLQLLQNPFHCTASGFFTLNYSLVHGLIGSVTKNLVILIQMESIYEPENTEVPNSTTLMQ